MMAALWERNALEVTDGEGAVLERMASQVPERLAIVEVGSYRGRSTCFLAAGAARGYGATIYAVDLWTDGPGFAVMAPGSHLDRPYAEPSTREAFDEAVAAHGHGLVTAVQGASVAVARGLSVPVGLVFVDGSHRTADVVADIGAWAPKVVRDGWIVFHDFRAPGVNAAIRSTIGQSPAWSQEPCDERRLGLFRRRAVARADA